MFDIVIVSYQSIDDLIDYKTKDLTAGEYYISAALYRVIKSDTITIDNQEYQLAGVIDDDYQGTYLEDVNYILYIPTMRANSGNYIVTFQDYKTISILSNQLKNKYSVSIVTKMDTDRLTNSLSLAKFMGRTFSTILIVLVTIFLFIIVIQLTLKIKSSFIYLKTNCVNYSGLEFSHIVLVLIQAICNFLICSFMQVIFIFGLNQFYHIQMNCISYLSDTFIFVIIYTIFINIPMFVIIHKINPVKIMREDN